MSKKLPQLTTNERAVLTGIYASEYHDGGDRANVWSWAIRSEGVAKKSIPGVVASLQSKGVVQCEGKGKEANIYVTDLGVLVWKALSATTAKPTKAKKAKPEAKPAKAAKPAKGAKGDAKGVPAAVVAAFDAWKDGAHLSELATKAGVKRSKLRRLFIKLAGGKPAFKAMRSNGAGGQVELFGGKRATPGARPALDDSKVPTIASARKADGWHYTPKRVLKAGSFEVFTSPDGIAYVLANANERADLIVTHKERGLTPTRLRKLDGSPVAKRARREEKLLKQGEASLKRTRAAKRAKRAARRSR